ncbi:MAG: hypothetical protein J1F63_00425 [Oscillospiraceae bacterium]|nr:hypothetical protein [Oscillospiraceae bacterium]
MASITTGIQLQDNFSGIMYKVIESVNLGLSAMSDMSDGLERNVDPVALTAARDAAAEATAELQLLSQAADGIDLYIRDNTNEQRRFNSEIENGTGAASELKDMIAGVAAGYVGMAGIRKATDFIQDCTEAYNTQLNAENQLMVVLGNMLDADYVAQFELETHADTSAAIAELSAVESAVDGVTLPVNIEGQALLAEFDAITQKAAGVQGKGIYGDEIMIAGAAELATYFTDTDAITMMMDTLADYAMGMSGGGALDATAMVNYATGLGKIMSGSYDAMTKKGFEFTDAQKDILEGEATRAQIVATLGEEYADMSADMQAAAVISQVVEESWSGLYETMSNAPEGKIIQMNNAFADLEETIGGKLYPYIILLVDTVNNNWPTIEGVIMGFVNGLQIVIGFLAGVAQGVLVVAGFFVDNWSWISPIIYGVAAALAVYYGWLGLVKLAELGGAAATGALTLAKMLAVPVYAALTGATMAGTAAQWGLNAALYACPIVWIIILVIALIAVIFAVVAAINHFADTSYSAIGFICGLFMIMLTNVVNKSIIPLQNMFASFVNFLGNVFNDPVAAIEVLFYDMCLTVLGYIKNLAHGIETLINKIPGVEVSITAGLDSFYDKLEDAQQKVKDESDWVEYMSKWDYWDYEEKFNAGYNFGKGIDDKLSSLSLDDLFNVKDLPFPEDYANSFTMPESATDNLSNIDKNTADMADGLNASREDLRLLRAIAERQAINKFTTAEIKIDFTSNATVNSDMDIDGVVNRLEELIVEGATIAAEGVHV